jgi:hypothetical protein
MDRDRDLWDRLGTAEQVLERHASDEVSDRRRRPMGRDHG